MKLSGKKGAALVIAECVLAILSCCGKTLLAVAQMKDLKRQLQQEKRHCERLQEQLTEVQKMKRELPFPLIKIGLQIGYRKYSSLYVCFCST